MLPVVALVGRPNVGKSTLFNRLTNTRDALVADFPGLTRDRKYGQATFEQRQFIVVDTGGITGDEEGIDAHMAQQSLLAIEEADVVLFLVDARAGEAGGGCICFFGGGHCKHTPHRIAPPKSALPSWPRASRTTPSGST